MKRDLSRAQNECSSSVTHKKRHVLPLIVASSLVLVAGCGTVGHTTNAGAAKTTGSNASAKKSSSDETSNSNSATKSNSKALVIYQAEHYAQPVAQAFTKKTGIPVKIVHLSTGSLAAKIQAEGKYAHWDLAWFDGAGTMQAIDNQGLLSTGWTPKNVSNYTSLGKSLVPKDDGYFPTGVSSAAVIAYNPKLMSSADAPKDWSDLLNSKYKGQIAMNDPSISGPTYPFVAGIIQERGLQRGEAYFNGLKKNGLHIFPKNGPTIQAMLSGKVKIALAQDAALVGSQVKGNPIKIVYPKSGAFVLPGDIAISKNSSKKSEAEQFIEFCLTPAAQKIMVNPKLSGSDAYHLPLVSGVSADSHVHTKGVNWVVVDPVAAAKKRSSVLKWFSDNVVH